MGRLNYWSQYENRTVPILLLLAMKVMEYIAVVNIVSLEKTKKTESYPNRFSAKRGRLFYAVRLVPAPKQLAQKYLKSRAKKGSEEASDEKT